jgi:putative oxidoreductase
LVFFFSAGAWPKPAGEIDKAAAEEAAHFRKSRRLSFIAESKFRLKGMQISSPLLPPLVKGVEKPKFQKNKSSRTIAGMKKLASILRLDFLPASSDVALLVLRLWLGLSLLLLHGWTKLSTFQKMSGGFPDPLKIGHRNSLILAIVGEVVCPILVVLGLFTRFGALGSMINMSTAFFFVHKLKLSGSGSGELAYLYLAGFTVIFLAGPGRFALDKKGSGGTKAAPKKPRPAND